MKPVLMLPSYLAREKTLSILCVRRLFISQTPRGDLIRRRAVLEIRHTPPSVRVPSTSIRNNLIFRARRRTSGEAISASEIRAGRDRLKLSDRSRSHCRSVALVVGVAMSATPVKRRTVGRIERPVFLDAFDKVRIGNEQAPEGDGVRLVLIDSLGGALGRVCRRLKGGVRRTTAGRAPRC